MAIIGVATTGHQAGHLELTIDASVVLQNIVCKSHRIASLKSMDSNRDMFAALNAALEMRPSVDLRITNDPSKTAYRGRCSPLAVQRRHRLHEPYSVHYGLAAAMRVTRQATLDVAFLANPKRFKNRRPVLTPMPTAAWINPPPEEKTPTSDPVARTLN